ncbi:MAG: RagB/SusD family nutrient uptake outer membrane protein [Bacteroidetes bacterium]|nr:RagB/SusD family nutrient uptake outer membrane protein [Bacteroidota bacterium]
MNMKKILLYLSLIAFGIAGCQKDLLDTTPYDQLSSSNMWTTDNLTDLGVNAIYEALRLGQNTGSASGLELYQYDRFATTGMQRDGTDAMLLGTITPSNALFSNNWRNFYEGVIRANDAIANIPQKSPSPDVKKGRLIAEAKFLRAYFYFRLNQVWKGVPIYLEPFKYTDATRPRSTETEVWNVILKDLSDAIADPNLPAKYAKGNANFGRVTKGAAYALRGKAHLFMGKWSEAAADFANVQSAGYNLFNDFRTLFKELNEQSDEMIFTLQNIGITNLGSTTQFFCGTRSSFGSCWNTYLVSPVGVDLFENINGSAFNWDDIIPGYTTMNSRARQVYFLRDNMTAAERAARQSLGADMTKYLSTGNEARIKRAFENRDPRLALSVITPYSTYNGVFSNLPSTVTSRFPFRAEAAVNGDLRTDTQAEFYYLHRKFVYEGNIELLNRSYGPIDFPIIRYADVLLMWAEALVEQNDIPGAIVKVNQVRARVGMPLLQTTDPSLPTYVSSQGNMRNRVRNERRVEFLNEGINYFDELRWGTWKTMKFNFSNGLRSVWGANIANYTWGGDHFYTWPIPQAEIQLNPNLTQNPGWPN